MPKQSTCVDAREDNSVDLCFFFLLYLGPQSLTEIISAPEMNIFATELSHQPSLFKFGLLCSV